MTTLSVIIPTVGRPELAETVASMIGQLATGDEVVIRHNDYGDWGMRARTEAMKVASGNYLMFMDDDDYYLPGAFAAVRAAIAAHPGMPLLFRMQRLFPFNDVLWRDKRAAYGNVSTQMFVTPNIKSRLGKWGNRYEGDLDFIQSTLALYPANSVVWCEDVIATWRRLL